MLAINKKNKNEEKKNIMFTREYFIEEYTCVFFLDRQMV